MTTFNCFITKSFHKDAGFQINMASYVVNYKDYAVKLLKSIAANPVNKTHGNY